MKKVFLSLLALIITTTISFGQAKITVDTVFNNYYKATGGVALWDSLSTYSMKRSYKSNSATDYDAEVYASIPQDAISKTKIVLKKGFIYASKGKEGWLKIPLGSSDKVTKYQVNGLSQTEQDNLKTEMYDFIVPFVNYKKRGLIATFVGKETVDKKDLYNVELQGKGVKYNLYFDTTSGLLVKQKKVVGTEQIVTDYTTYTKSKYGISYPSAAVETSSKDKKAIKVTSTVNFNEKIAPSYFTK
jgi:hypothetical protein